MILVAASKIVVGLSVAELATSTWPIMMTLRTMTKEGPSPLERSHGQYNLS
jgi:hypothetical protein